MIKQRGKTKSRKHHNEQKALNCKLIKEETKSDAINPLQEQKALYSLFFSLLCFHSTRQLLIFSFVLCRIYHTFKQSVSNLTSSWVRPFPSSPNVDSAFIFKSKFWSQDISSYNKEQEIVDKSQKDAFIGWVTCCGWIFKTHHFFSHVKNHWLNRNSNCLMWTNIGTGFGEMYHYFDFKLWITNCWCHHLENIMHSYTLLKNRIAFQHVIGGGTMFSIYRNIKVLTWIYEVLMDLLTFQIWFFSELSE